MLHLLSWAVQRRPDRWRHMQRLKPRCMARFHTHEGWGAEDCEDISHPWRTVAPGVLWCDKRGLFSWESRPTVAVILTAPANGTPIQREVLWVLTWVKELADHLTQTIHRFPSWMAEKWDEAKWCGALLESTDLPPDNACVLTGTEVSPQRSLHIPQFPSWQPQCPDDGHAHFQGFPLQPGHSPQSPHSPQQLWPARGHLLQALSLWFPPPKSLPNPLVIRTTLIQIFNTKMTPHTLQTAAGRDNVSQESGCKAEAEDAQIGKGIRNWVWEKEVVLRTGAE